MYKENSPYKPKYLTPRHALIPKKCKFCHNDMEIKQINSTEAFRMCFKCSTPLQQLDLGEIEFFHRSYKDMLKSPLEWNTNVCEEDDDLAKLSLWIEQMELKVSKYEDSSDDETLGSSFKSQKPVIETSENSSMEGSLHDWQSEVHNELEAALEKATSENSQSHNLPFSFDDFFLPSSSTTLIETDSCASTASYVGPMEGVQKCSEFENISEISQDRDSQECERHVSQSQSTEVHESRDHFEEMTKSTNTEKMFWSISKENEPIEDKSTSSIEQLFRTNNKINSNYVQEKDLNADCSANKSPEKSGNVCSESEIQLAALECVENENSFQADMGDISEHDSLTNISENAINKGNVTELSSAHTSSSLEIVSMTEGNNISISAQDKLQAVLDNEREASENRMEIQDCMATNKHQICEKKTINEDSENDGEVFGCDKKDGEICVGIKTLPSALLKNRLFDSLSESDSPISSATELFPITSAAKSNGAESEFRHQEDETPVGEFRNTTPETLPQSSVSQMENSTSNLVLSKTCGLTLPSNLWSSLSQCLSGNILVYEHVCDCDEKQIQLPPTNDDHDNQCMNLELPDLSPSSLMEEDILKSNSGSHSLDKILFKEERYFKKKCLQRKPNFLEGTRESYDTAPIFIIPADSDITQDMLQIESDDDIPVIFSDSIENTSVDASLEERCTPSSSVEDVKEPLLLNNVCSSGDSGRQICLNKDLGQTPFGMTVSVENFNIKINFAQDINDTPFISGDSTPFISGDSTPFISGDSTPFISGDSTPFISGDNTPFINSDNECNTDVALEKRSAPVQDSDEINGNLLKNTPADFENSDVESYESSSHFETSNYSHFIEGMNETCSSSVSEKKDGIDSMEEKSFRMMIDRPLQLHGITIEEDDEELKCFAGAKFRPIANRKPSLKEGKIESEPRVMNLLKSVRREVKMAKAPKLEKMT